MYLAYLLSTMNLGRLSGQSAQPGLSVKVLSIQPVWMPSKETQDRVVAILAAMDDKMATNERINDNLEQQAQAIFVNMFADNENVMPATIADVALNVTDGVHNTVHDDPEGEFMLLSCKNIKGGSLSIGTTERRISYDTFEKLRRRTRLSQVLYG